MTGKRLAAVVTRRDVFRRFAAGTCGLGLALAACQSAESPPPPPKADVSKAAPAKTEAARPSEWNVVAADQTGGGDPLTEYGTNAQYYLQAHVTEPLAQAELIPNGTSWNMVPHLADQWRFADERTFVMTLKQGVKFHNGEELTAEHVKFSYDGIVKAPQPGRRATSLKPLGESEVVDKYTIRWRMPAPDLSVLRGLGDLLVVPLARKEMKAEEFERKPIGTGPYKVVGWTRDGTVQLEAWEGYRLGRPFPPRLTVRYVPEPSTRVAELLAGTAQIAQRIPVEAIPSLDANPKLEAVSLKGGSTFSYVINLFRTTPPLRDKRIRQAMNLAVDREAIVRTVLSGRGIVTPGPLGPGWMGYTDDVQPYPYDPDRAKALLKEAGYADGFAFTWTVTQGVYTKDIEVAEAAAAHLAKVGIKANLKPTERARLLADRNEGEFDVIELTWPMAWYPSVMFAFSLYSPFPDSKLTPKWGATPAELVEARRLGKEAEATVDVDRMASGYAKVNRLMHDEAFWLYIQTVDHLWGVQKDTGWRPYPGNWPDLYWYDYWPMIGRRAPSDPNVPLIVK